MIILIIHFFLYIWKWLSCCRSNQPGGEGNGKPDLFPALEAKLPDDPEPGGHHRGQVISLKLNLNLKGMRVVMQNKCTWKEERVEIRSQGQK